MAGPALGRRILPRVLAASAVVALALAGSPGRSPTVVAAAASTTSTATTSTATAALASTPREASPGPTVTLITGDRIQLRSVGSGRTTATVEPAPRPSGVVPQFQVSTREGRTSVIPTDMGPLLRTDVLDPALFDVTALAKQGYDDAASPSLPLILTYPKEASRTYRTRTVPGGRERRVLDSVDGVATEVPKDEVAKLGKAVFELAEAAQQTGRRASSLTAAQAGPLAGVRKIWLDARVRVALDRSTKQIDAPAAWDAGYTGSGVKVAVLDTGIDTTHPDLAGRVSASHNFTDTGDAGDRFGHGTHVASIVGGSGAASDGARKGVAYGADLVNGKVLGDDGYGATSWIIDGMEWAAGVEHADIVNMSLGSDPSEYGSNLVTAAVDRLSSEDGTLFVVAAGNNGCDACVLAPGDAPSALTVGAVDRQDQLADFSSRGPGPVNLSLKPDITAPGVGIWAARAEDAQLGGSGPYLELSGTSMATPHVAGAAALLSQARPELTGRELKAALMSTAVPTAGLREYQQGAGRVDVARVLKSPVLAEQGSLDFGVVALKAGGGTAPVDRDVSYRNISGQPVTLNLHVQLRDETGAQVGYASVEPSQLTVQPGAVGTANVVVDPGTAEPGNYTGALVADVPGAQSLHTPTGFVGQPQLFDLRLKGIARDGRPALAWVGSLNGSPVVNVDTGETMTKTCRAEDPTVEVCMRVPAGTYSVLAFVHTRPAGVPSNGYGDGLDTSLVGNPELKITGDTTVTLDARKAVEVKVDTPANPEARANLGGAVELRWYRTAPDGTVAGDAVLNAPGSQGEERFFVQPMSDPSVGFFEATSRWRLEAPNVTLSVPGAKDVKLDPQYYPMNWFSDFSEQFPVLDGSANLRVVDAGQGRPEDLAGLDLKGALALVRRSDDLPVAEQSNTAADAGARMVAVYNDSPGANGNPGGYADLALKVPTVRLTGAEGGALLGLLGKGKLTVRATGNVASPYVYDLVYAEPHGVPAQPHYSADPSDLVRVEEDIHSLSTDQITYSEGAFAFRPQDQMSITFQRPLYGAPRSRVVYHTSDPTTRWSYVRTTPEQPYGYHEPHPEGAQLQLNTPLTAYAPRERTTQSWLGAPVATGLNPNFPVVRDGDLLVLGESFPSLFQGVGMLDGANHPSVAASTEGDDGFATMFRLSRGDETVWETEHIPGGLFGYVTLPTGSEDTYRMSFDVANRAPWAQLSTRSRSEWTFRSAATDAAEPLPLLTFGYDVEANLRNELTPPARGSNQVKVRVGHQAGGSIPVNRLTFEVSYDDGGRWQHLRAVRHGDGRYTVDLPPNAPAKARYASFRVHAQDADGNQLTQEIIRAVALPHGR
ncbi:S8 family peptidase [Actinopolymorpha singaporensis]|uniref:Serine protease, subtilisin family n=1 Tax=Actinopolymorpha singaporensis TaxID=117157 RepID=A0A1H1RJU8_9ACTN|nr:S8 family serine peptidase [Actinopolymorpha singaporensis]SDS35239.1 Serine protease, subtilisin family [Actinopolymorpha singaporensis]